MAAAECQERQSESLRRGHELDRFSLPRAPEKGLLLLLVFNVVVVVFPRVLRFFFFAFWMRSCVHVERCSDI